MAIVLCEQRRIVAAVVHVQIVVPWHVDDLCWSFEHWSLACSSVRCLLTNIVIESRTR